MTSEEYIVAIRYVQGRKVVKRHQLLVPLNLATGKYERLSDLAIREMVKDLTAEQQRRAQPRDPNRWTPDKTQFRGEKQ